MERPHPSPPLPAQRFQVGLVLPVISRGVVPAGRQPCNKRAHRVAEAELNVHEACAGTGVSGRSAVCFQAPPRWQRADVAHLGATEGAQ